MMKHFCCQICFIETHVFALSQTVCQLVGGYVATALL